MSKLDTAFELFDRYNQQDPHHIDWEGHRYPAEYFYALQLYNWVKQLHPQASEALLLASRCQHIGRWKMPRDTYPAGKSAYLKWRSDLSAFHADTAAKLLFEAGYNKEMINAVQQIIRKKDLRLDPDVQVIENALCLVFLQFQYENFIKEHEDEKVIHIIQKTWKKMNEDGRHAALKLPFEGRAKGLLEQALSL